jgi:nifR3 family TIM-barrel protein
VQIGSLTLTSPFILAPLAGYTDLPFRILCREYGAGLCYSEMISCHGLVYEQKNTINMLATVEEERPVAMQLFGADAKMMAKAAALLTRYPIDFIDINMGCPVKKVIKRGAGCALMKDPPLAAAIIRGVVKEATVPVTVKIRTGWRHSTINCCDFAKMAEDKGAAAIAVHGRTWSDGFSGTADWRMIGQVKESVAIPVIGNGDIHSYQDGHDMMAQTGCDAVMIGRASLGAPWIFSAVASANPSLLYRLTALNRHLDLIEQFFPAEKIFAKIKNQSGRYFRGLPGAAMIRKQIFATKSFNEFRSVIDSLAPQ